MAARSGRRSAEPAQSLEACGHSRPRASGVSGLRAALPFLGPDSLDARGVCPADVVVARRIEPLDRAAVLRPALGLAVDLADPHLRLAVLREVLDGCSNSNRSKAEAAAAVNGVKIDTLGLLGTVGTGKTDLGAHHLLSIAYQFPKTYCPVFRQNISTAMKTVIPSYLEMADKMGLVQGETSALTSSSTRSPSCTTNPSRGRSR